MAGRRIEQNVTPCVTDAGVTDEKLELRRTLTSAQAGRPAPGVKRPRFKSAPWSRASTDEAHNTRGRPPRARGQAWPERKSSNQHCRPRVLFARRQARRKRGCFTPSLANPAQAGSHTRPNSATLQERGCEIVVFCRNALLVTTTRRFEHRAIDVDSAMTDFTAPRLIADAPVVRVLCEFVKTEPRSTRSSTCSGCPELVVRRRGSGRP